AMAAAAREVAHAARLPLGINVLRSDGVSALAVALAAGARFIRVNVHVGAGLTDQGILQGGAPELPPPPPPRRALASACATRWAGSRCWWAAVPPRRRPASCSPWPTASSWAPRS